MNVGVNTALGLFHVKDSEPDSSISHPDEGLSIHRSQLLKGFDANSLDAGEYLPVVASERRAASSRRA